MALAAEIVSKVDQKFVDTIALRKRMEEDYDRWRLKPFSHKLLTDYEVYTSNEPRTFVRKALALLNGAALTIRCPQNNDPREQRDQDNAKEQFARGNLKANDARLDRIGQIPLRQSMAFHLLVRGFTCGRATLVKWRGRAWADATPWDPTETVWEYGPNGLLWICRRYGMLRSAAERDWQVPPVEKPGEQVVTVYDYYDEFQNIVVVPEIQEEPVKAMLHDMVDGYGEPQVPAWCVANPLQPPVQSGAITGRGTNHPVQLGDDLVDYGESIFSENREVWDTHNYNMSIMKNLAGRSLKPVFGIRSRDGVKLVEGDPFQTGAEIPLAEDEELIVYDMLQSAPDMLPYMTVNQGEMQRGGFPVIFHGELPAPISGFMGTILKSGPGDKVTSAAQAIERALKTITNMWCDQFMTGSYGSFELSGQGGNRKWFVATISPDMIRDLPELEIALKPQLPEDDAGKVQQAMLLRQPGVTGQQLLSDFDIRETILEREDSDRDLDAIMQEMAAIHPLVQAHRFADALAKRGDEGAQYWQGQWMMLALQALQAGFLPFGLLESPDMPKGQNGGMNPQVAPNAVQGRPSPRPGVSTPFQGGAVVPPGTPRRGAQNGRNGGRLRRGIPPLP